MDSRLGHSSRIDEMRAKRRKSQRWWWRHITASGRHQSAPPPTVQEAAHLPANRRFAERCKTFHQDSRRDTKGAAEGCWDGSRCWEWHKITTTIRLFYTWTHYSRLRSAKTGLPDAKANYDTKYSRATSCGKGVLSWHRELWTIAQWQWRAFPTTCTTPCRQMRIAIRDSTAGTAIALVQE